MDFEDKKLVCKDCTNSFLFTAGEQDFYQHKGFRHEPGRCPECCIKRKQQATEQGQSTLQTAPPPNLTSVITCSKCGTVSTVPFQPDNQRPVYCSACYGTIKQPAALATSEAVDEASELLEQWLKLGRH